MIDGRDHPKSLARYANNAKDKGKNARFETNGLRVFPVAIKDIEAGGEILVDYGRK